MSKADKGRSGKDGKGKAKKPSAEAAALAESPSHLLHRALQLALDVYATETGPGAVTQRQYAVLAAVAAAEHPTQTDLVRMTGIDRSTLADMVARMITKGLLGRERSASDGRANLVRLTPEGQAALDEAGPKVEQADQRILSVLGAGKRAAFIDALAKLARAGEVALVTDEANDLPGDGKKAKKAAKDGAAKKADGKDKDGKDRDGKDRDGKGGKKKDKKAAKAERPAAPFEPPRLVAPE